MPDQNPGTCCHASCWSGGHVPGDLAHALRLAPVLHDQAPAGGGVPGEGGVAATRHARRDGLHRCVAWDAVVVELAGPRRARELGVRHDAGAGHDRSSATTSRPFSSTTGAPVLDALHGAAEHQLDAGVGEPARDARPASAPSSAACGTASSPTSCTRAPVSASEAATSQPMKPEPITATPPRPPALRDAIAVVRVAEAQHGRVVATGDGQTGRPRRRSPGNRGREVDRLAARAAGAGAAASSPRTGEPTTVTISFAAYQATSSSGRSAAVVSPRR